MYDLEKIKRDIEKFETKGDSSKEDVFTSALDSVHQFLENLMYVNIDELVYAVSFYLIHSKDGEVIKQNIATALKRAVANENALSLYSKELTSLQCALDNQRER